MGGFPVARPLEGAWLLLRWRRNLCSSRTPVLGALRWLDAPLASRPVLGVRVSGNLGLRQGYDSIHASQF